MSLLSPTDVEHGSIAQCRNIYFTYLKIKCTRK